MTGKRRTKKKNKKV